jgi:hypothetical protein
MPKSLTMRVLKNGEMGNQTIKYCTAFDGFSSLASGEVYEVAGKVKELIDRGEALSTVIFDDITSEILEIDFRGSMEEILKRLENTNKPDESASESFAAEQTGQRGPGRPRLGVIPREVTLLPRHWEWLNGQPGGASVALRKLVEEARRINSEQDGLRISRQALYRFMSAMAGDFPGFEDAARALFAGEVEKFNERIALWPADIRTHVQKLAVNAFPD